MLNFSVDSLIVAFDKSLRTLATSAQTSRVRPDTLICDMDNDEMAMTDVEKRHAAALMRVNHCGEVCAQALYSGQALTSRDAKVTEALREAAKEEIDHLAWCETRIQELGGRKSVMNPIWYAGSFSLGVVAGVLGDRWNLGFLAETENQVAQHLDDHLDALPATDYKTRTIVTQMRTDEMSHANTAQHYGAAVLPIPVKRIMRLAAKVMTKTSYYL